MMYMDWEGGPITRWLNLSLSLGFLETGSRSELGGMLLHTEMYMYIHMIIIYVYMYMSVDGGEGMGVVAI